MTVFTTILSTMTTLFAYLILLVALQKLFSIGKDLSEIKEMLRETKRERDAAAILAVARDEREPDNRIESPLSR